MQSLKVISNYTREGYSESFSERFPFIKVIREEDFFFECDAYDVMIPSYEYVQPAIYLLEKAVLKLIELHPEYSDTEISDALCVTDEGGSDSLVRMIHTRLKTLCMLDENDKITKEGTEQLSSGKENKNGKQRLILAQVFSIRQLNNYLLPFIHMGEIESEFTEMLGKNAIAMTVGSAGNEKVKRGYYCRIPNNAPKSVAPRKQDIINIIDKYNKLSRDLTGRTALKYDQEYALDIAVHPSRVVLHMKIVLQEGNVEHPLISDGFSCDISGLAEYLKNHTEYIDKLMERSIISKDKEDTDEKEITQYELHEFQKLHSALIKAGKAIGNTLDASTLAYSECKKYLLNHYYALEWALHYHLLRMPVPEATMSLLLSQSKTENLNYSIRGAQKLNLLPIKDYAILSATDRFELKKWQDTGVPVLKTLLPVAISGAIARDEDNFRVATSEMPELMQFLARFHKIANLLRHGSENQVISKKQIDILVEKTRTFIHYLLPSFQFQDAQQEKIIQSVDASQDWLEAQVSVAQFLGWDMVRTLSDNLKQLIFSVAPKFDGRPEKQLSPNDFILTLSQIMETAMADELTTLVNINTNLSMNDALLSIEHDIGRRLDDAFYNVTPSFYKTALHQKKTTLNAMVLVYFAFSDRKRVAADAKLDQHVSIISELRGHGNNVNLSLTYEKLAELRNSTFELVKIIGGYV